MDDGSHTLVACQTNHPEKPKPQSDRGNGISMNSDKEKPPLMRIVAQQRWVFLSFKR
jgi:hypothetical protein